MRTILCIVLTAAAATLNAADFQWKGSVPAGKTIEIKNISGKIVAETAMTGQVEVTAVKTAKRSDPNSVTVQVVPHGDGVTICAVYPTPSGSSSPNECAAGNGGRMNSKDNDVVVEFLVKVPAGVHLAAKTVNGGIVAQNLRSDVRASTVNGSIDVSSSELVRAKTVNGSIRANLGLARWTEELAFETVNGSVTIHMPAGVNANFKAQTVNGSVRSDFPITVQGRLSRQKMEGTLGSGGPELKVHTVNGNVELLKG